MGAGSSKAAEPSQHVFAADTPVRFSHELVESLQSNPETDGARARVQERKMQSRVTDELQRLEASESQRLAELTARIASETSQEQADQSPAMSEKIGDAMSGSSERADRQKQRDMSRDLVAREIAELRTKLDGRRKREEPDKRVEEARNELVTCLRANDRRPLDCWKEVDAFRKEVGRLEKDFVEKAVR